MTLDAPELAHVLLALGLLLAAAHGCGYAMTRLRQPRVIGEIIGGLLLGPTVLGALAPGVESALFPSSGSVPAVLDAIYQLGLLFLMFTAGAEMRGFFHRRERRALTSISIVGMLVPFAAGLAVVPALHLESLHGAAATDPAFILVFGIAVAITSIPVISRIMLDLGILDTSFARVVLGVAVVEDVVLYVLFAIALGLVAQGPGDVWGLPVILGIAPSGPASVVYHVVAELGFLGAMMAGSPWLYRKLLHRYNPVKRGNDIGFQLVFVLAVSIIAMWLGVVPLLGAFVAGLVVSTSTGIRAAQARESIKAFSFAFFIPVYFATVGLRLDLLSEFSPLFFVPFFLFACAVKSLSVYAGARLGGEGKSSSKNLAVALNARGGPGIVLASVALDARIISASFYSSLVMLAVLTSLIAGSWLGRIVRSGRPIREEAPEERPGQDPPVESAG
ncbi:MAG: cation:proton antiporter [Actinomycetota bacterium]|nr:cation:proton antiporter [Actinomycetota bacterium]